MVLLKGKNPNISDLERTEMKAAAVAAATSIDVDWTENFAANDYVVIGTLGTEVAELVRITAVTDTDTLAVTALTHDHSIDEPVQKSLYNQLRFYSDADNYASALSTEDLDWANPNQFTHYNDTAGTSTTKYKYAFYNAQTTTESDQSAEFEIPTYYCTLADVEDYLNLSFGQQGEIKPFQVIKFIRLATAEIDRETGTSFKTNTVATSDYEYHTGKPEGQQQVYFTSNRPVISITDFATTTSDETIGPTNATYNTLTDNDHFVADLNTGRFTILDPQKFPAVGPFRVRMAYTWGRSSVPDDIKRLAILVTVRDLAQTTGGRNILMGREININLSDLNAQIQKIVMRYRVSFKNA